MRNKFFLAALIIQTMVAGACGSSKSGFGSPGSGGRGTATGGRGGADQDGAPPSSGGAAGAQSDAAVAGKGGSSAPPDAAGMDGSADVVPPQRDGGGDLSTVLPDGQCAAQGAILSVTLDGMSLDGLTWRPIDDPQVRRVSSSSFASSLAGDVGFSVAFDYTGMSIGTFALGPLNPSVSFGDQPSFQCAGADVTGELRITSITKGGGPTADRVCGVYDVDCSASSHRLHVRSSFDALVKLTASPGAP